MITQIEIDGFKTFKDFKVELAPFQVIVGPNGSGKSNLFDALHLLSRLADVDDLRLAFQAPDNDPQKLRGDAHQLFTVLPDGLRTDRIRMAVEMLIDRGIQDNLGGQAELKYTRLRYEIEVTRRTDKQRLERLYVAHESLKSIPQDEDNWCKKYGLSLQNSWLSQQTVGQAAFITTLSMDNPGLNIEHPNPTINLHPEGQGAGRILWAERVQRTVLSSVINTDYPHVFAAREEMRSWKFLHLSHETLRQPSPVNAPSFLSIDGSNLPTMLARMQIEDRFLLNDVSRDLANLVPDVVGVELKKDPVENKYTIWVKYEDGRSFPSPVLSDGTLRLLALATLKNDPQFHGVLCFEEPENGVHPSYLNEIAHLLRGLATDFSDPQQVDEPLRQVLVTTHSPAFISQPDAIDALLFTYTTTRVEPLASGIPPMRITQAAPVVTSNSTSSWIDIDKREESYTIDRVKELLTNDYLNEALDRLDKSQTLLKER